MKHDRVERICITLIIILLISILHVQISLHATNKRLQVQIDTMQSRIEIQAARDTYIEAKIDYLAHPVVQSQRAYDWVMRQGEFANER